jgi:ribonuclease HI
MNQSKLSHFFSIQKSEAKSETTSKINKKVRPAQKINDNTYSLYFDGCSKGNPGHAGAGAVLYLGNNEIWAKSIYVGNRSTNNAAEYSGMILGMNEAITKNISELSVYGDSMLVIKQMRGEYKVTSDAMKLLFDKAKLLEKQFSKISYTHVYRDKNTRADELSNQGLIRSA